MKYLLVSILAVLVVGCNQPEPSLYGVQGDAFGTTYSIQYYAEAPLSIEKGLDSVFDVVNRSVSTYIPDSDISKINSGDTTVVVDDIFKEVFLLSEAVHENSNGYFDPTIGVLRNAYGFGDVAPLERIDTKVLDSLMQFVGFQKVQLLEDGRIAKSNPKIYFDFNAVAKGYGIDCLGRYLSSLGVENYLVELGGEVLAEGKNLTKDKGWIVGIETVDSQLGDRSFSAKIFLQDGQAMASSGNYRKFRVDTVTGQKYVHTLNPLTGSAEKSDVTSATVVTSNCGAADAYATACMALGLEGSKNMLKKLDNVEVYLTYNDSLGMEQVFLTEGFRSLLVD